MFKKEIDLKDGSGVQVFEAETQDELIDKLATAQLNATQKIRSQEKDLKLARLAISPDPDNPLPEFKPRTLSADERFIIAQDLQDPAKAGEATRKLMEAEFGAPLDVVRDTLSASAMGSRVAAAKRSVDTWLETHKDDYKPTAHNQTVIVNYLQNRKWAMTEKNLDKAFEELRENGLLDLSKEVVEEPKKEEVKVEERIVRARATSTGLRTSDASASETKKAPQWTKRDIDAMSTAEYRKNFANPDFRRIVDGIGR